MRKFYNKRLFIIIGITLALICVFFYQKIKFNNSLSKIENQKKSLFQYSYLPELFYEKHDQYPKNQKEIDNMLDVISQEGNPEAKFLFLQDYLSKNRSLVDYYPVFDKNSKEIISYIFLSAGIDGKMDNILSDQDTLFYDDWHLKLKTYNYEDILVEPEDADYVIYANPDMFFSIWDRFFGKKDYVIMLKKVTELQ